MAGLISQLDFFLYVFNYDQYVQIYCHWWGIRSARSVHHDTATLGSGR